MPTQLLNDPHSFNDETLYVVAVISNPARYKRRYELYRHFEAYMTANPKVALYTVELAYGDRPFEVTDPTNPRHIQIRSQDELWHKENMINIGVAHLPPTWKYMAWIDADVKFARHDWAEETIHQLQHYPMVQLFSHSAMLDANNVPHQMSISFAFAYRQGLKSFDKTKESAPFVFGMYGKTPYKTGLGFAYTRECFEAIGGMMDRCIIGSADYHMAAASIGRAAWTIPDLASDAYRNFILRWQGKCSFICARANRLRRRSNHALLARSDERSSIWRTLVYRGTFRSGSSFESRLVEQRFAAIFSYR